MAELSDTSPEARRVQLELLRQKTPAERLAMAVRLSSDVIQMSKRAIARVHPEFTPQQVGHMFVEIHYGKALAEAMRQHERKRENARAE